MSNTLKRRKRKGKYYLPEYKELEELGIKTELKEVSREGNTVELAVYVNGKYSFSILAEETQQSHKQ